MKPETRFMKIFSMLPEEARSELVFNYWSEKPMSLNVIAIEVRGKTELGRKVLEELGFADVMEEQDKGGIHDEDV